MIRKMAGKNITMQILFFLYAYVLYAHAFRALVLFSLHCARERVSLYVPLLL